MGPRDFNLVFAAAGTRPLNVSAKYVHVMAAPSGSVFITLDDGVELERVSGEGIFVGDGFRRVDIRSAVAQTVRVMVAEEPQVTGGGATGAPGGVATSVAVEPSSAVATPAATNLATGAASTIAANAARKRITICALSTNTGSLFIQAVGAGAGRGLELQPGLFTEVATTSALDVRNDSGAAQDFTTFEET